MDDSEACYQQPVWPGPAPGRKALPLWNEIAEDFQLPADQPRESGLGGPVQIDLPPGSEYETNWSPWN